eukprot:5248-Eustigmatos_ZCMA.PRE.1
MGLSPYVRNLECHKERTKVYLHSLADSRKRRLGCSINVFMTDQHSYMLAHSRMSPSVSEPLQ